MRGIKIYLADGTYDGAITMESTASKFTAARIPKSEVSQYSLDLEEPGIYFLLIGSDSVYVGQSGLDTVRKRILNTHSGSIDSSWHTVVGFMATDKTISSNELLFIENAMCEYAHQTYGTCLTTTPSKANCNAAYRKGHYHLSSGQIHSCNQYIEDIKFYINCFPNTVFPAMYQVTAHPSVNTEMFYFRNPKRDTDGRAEIEIQLGHTKARKTILKKGSKISADVSFSFGGHQSVVNLRNQYIAAGKIVHRVLQEDIIFNSQSGAGQFLNGTSFDGNSKWKTISGDQKLKDLL